LYIKTTEIPEGGLDVFKVRGKEVIPRLLEGMNPFPLRAIRLVAGELHLTLSERDVFLSGSFEAEGDAVCDRCAEAFTLRLGREFDAVLVPRSGESPGAPKVELHREDMEISFYDGTGVEVADVFWEQAAMALPVKVLCEEDCRGVCPGCGVNLNREACTCPGESHVGPFDVLKKLKK
jgi:uncharacterized protein